MGYCKHRWEDRTNILRDVFLHDKDRRTHEFYVCARCLRIDEVLPDGKPSVKPLDRRSEAA